MGSRQWPCGPPEARPAFDARRAPGAAPFDMTVARHRMRGRRRDRFHARAARRPGARRPRDRHRTAPTATARAVPPCETGRASIHHEAVRSAVVARLGRHRAVKPARIARAARCPGSLPRSRSEISWARGVAWAVWKLIGGPRSGLRRAVIIPARAGHGQGASSARHQSLFAARRSGLCASQTSRAPARTLIESEAIRARARALRARMRARRDVREAPADGTLFLDRSAILDSLLATKS